MSEEMERRFFDFMAAREALRLKKESGAPWPWSDDPILNTYKFTNVKREHDRTTRWMREHWTRPNENRPGGEIIFNCALFRYFGTMEFAEAIGWQTNWLPDGIKEIARQRSLRKECVFTGAYIIPTLGLQQPKYQTVCDGILSPLWSMKETISQVALDTRSWRETARALTAIPGFGGTGFMAKETLQDVMQTPVLKNAIDRNSWCPAGPGAQRGLNRIAGRYVNTSLKTERSLDEMIALHLGSQSVLPDFMPILELHDIQFQLCEFDKYERARLGQGRPKSRYKIKDKII